MERLLAGPTLLDGAMGTALMARGLTFEVLPEQWLELRPEVIAAVHADHAAAGAQLLLTCTFNLAAPRLALRIPDPDVEQLAARAVELARRSAGSARVAGDLGPSNLYGPGRPAPDAGRVEAGYARAAAALADAGADLLWVESQWDQAEALLALGAARRTGLPVLVTFGFREQGAAFVAADGSPAEELLLAVADAGAAAAGASCVPPGPALAALARFARAKLPVPFLAKPTAGLPGATASPEAFAAALWPAVGEGLRVLGGCCGADAAHLRALAPLLARA